jgi:TfoX/Sxy family transcriptional regulator of competence genes
MVSSRAIVDFLVDQMSDAGIITAKKMFGEYGLYCDGKLVALVCDDRLLVKPTDGGRTFAADSSEEPPYPGAKPSILVDPERWDNQAWLHELIRITHTELPATRPGSHHGPRTRRGDGIRTRA